MQLTTTAPASAASNQSHLNRPNPVLYVVLIIAGITALLPFIWMLLASIKSFGDFIFVDFSTAQNTVRSFWPWPPLGTSAPALGNYGEAIRRIDLSSTFRATSGYPLFLRQWLNTFAVAVTHVVGVLLTSALAAYAFSMLEFPGKRVMFILVLTTLMIPEELLLVPRVIMMYEPLRPEQAAGVDVIISLIPRFGWQNTIAALTIPFLASAFTIFLLRQYFLQVPRDLFEAARLDGAGHLRYLAQMMLPLAKPALVTTGLLQFIYAWNEFKWTQLVTRDLPQRTLSVSLQNFLQTDGGAEGQLAMAVAAMVVLPIIILYLFTQQYLVEGVAKSGVK